MGQEIERARALLGALARDGVLVGERADAAYEAWVAHAGGDEPFARFLIRERRADAGRVRATLRVMAVEGMVHPERFTLERFEDLLMGQLGIDAGILSPKLLQTVRAVQDKKVEEGKLRRLDDLLPRAGFDPVQLRILREHLAERVLVCPGCLARFPRRDQGVVEHDCPRCGDRIATGAVKESELGLLPEPAKRQLLSTSGENSGVFETLTVAARERRTPPPQAKDRSAATPGVVVAAVASVALVAGLAFWALSDGRRDGRRLAPRPPRDTTSPAEPAPPGPPPTTPAVERPPTYAEARALDRRWAAEGKWTELIDVSGAACSPGRTRRRRTSRAAR
ncbi:MAG: hypothetical protein M9894_37430 [Planctomycetes bacterium]|nr:hypothetical protein [Planctomycetota bacterium]